MQYQVPQFIEVEDKLVGPFTFKQLIYLGGGLGLAYVAHVYLPTFIEIFVIIASVGLGFCLAFVKINKKPFIYTMEAAFKFIIHSRLYVWRKEPKAQAETRKLVAPPEAQNLKETTPFNTKKLKDLAWSLDIREDIQGKKENTPPKSFITPQNQREKQ